MMPMPNDINLWPAIIREFFKNRPAIKKDDWVLNHVVSSPARDVAAAIRWIKYGKWDHPREKPISMVIDFSDLERALLKYGLTEREINKPLA